MNLANVEFKNEQRFLSNMWPCTIKMDSELAKKYPMFLFDDKEYGSSEHLYQALKSKNMEYREIIRALEKPTQTKTTPRKILSRDIEEGKYLERADWDVVKVDAMKLCLELKFSQNEDLKQKLIDTKFKYLEERNDWNDKFWGTYLGEGQNILGELLMENRFFYSSENQKIKFICFFFLTKYELLVKKGSNLEMMIADKLVMIDIIDNRQLLKQLGYIQGLLFSKNLITFYEEEEIFENFITKRTLY